MSKPETVEAEAEAATRKVCKYCGRRITWGMYPESTGWGWHPPLGYVGTAYIILDGVVHKVPTYLRHECDPGDVRRHQAEVQQAREERRAAHRSSALYLEQREIDAQLLTIFNEESMKVDCPRCHIAAGGMCINLSKARSGQHVEVKKAHIERWRQVQARNPEIGDLYGPHDPRKDEHPNDG